ncbi:MAG TPA: hypothetical protein VHB97_02570 [Polyangia bacterium]|nr:hypothetical protein [Polyangia bacterium]
MSIADDAEDELIRRARAGDTIATEALIAELAPPLLRLAHTCASDDLVTADVLEALARAISGALATFDRQAHVSFHAHALGWAERAIAALLSRTASRPTQPN